MALKFEIQLRDDECAATKVEQVKKYAADSKYDIALEGDEQSGKFLGIVKGDYEIDGQCLAINITKKPMIMSDSMIRKTITKFFA